MTDKLRIAELVAGNLGGSIGLTLVAGEPSDTVNIDLQLDAAADWDAAAVTTFEKIGELKFDGIAVGDAVRNRFMEWHPFPAGAVDAPGAAFMKAWCRHGARLRNLVAAGNKVLVHCDADPQHAGMVVARLLVETGSEPGDAIATVRRELGVGAIGTGAPEAWVRAVQRLGDRVVDEAGARDRALGALLGLAVGDAVGTTIEFSPKPARAVLHDMVGGGPFGLDAGQWTDDTSMALALGDSLLAHPGLDPDDLMRRFVSWHRDGDYSCTGECFDIGGTTASALRRYERTGEPFAGSTAPDTAGNGSIMRFAPVAIRHWRDPEELLRVARDQSRTTHGAPEAVQACETLAKLLSMAIRGAMLPDLVSCQAAREIRGFHIGQSRDEVQGSGYVVESLHAALWAVSRTSSYRSAVLLAANLGRDADTTAAIAGQIAGALYGASTIPAKWLHRLAWRERIERIGGDLFDAGRPIGANEASS